MSSKRSGLSSDIADPDVQRKKLKSSTNSRHRSSECTLQTLGDDEICHILSFILCLPKPAKAPKKPQAAFMYHYKHSHGAGGKDLQLCSLGLPPEGPAAPLAEFRKLPDDEQRKYYRMASIDWTIFNANMARYKNYLKQRFFLPGELAESTRTLKLVCKQMHRVVGKCTNHSAPQDIITPEHLANIKARVGRLDLSSPCQNFVKLCDDMYCDRKFLPSDLYHQHGDDADHCPMLKIATHYSNSDYDVLAKLISEEYRKILAIKAVELVAKKDKAERNDTSASSPSSSWTKTSMPGQLVHTFWQAHMLSPRKYYEDCISITGEIIDCDRSSYSEVDPEIVRQFYAKRKKLFAFEHKLKKEYFHTGRQPALYMIENVIETASMLREEEAMEGHDYSSDDEENGQDDNDDEEEAEGEAHNDD